MEQGESSGVSTLCSFGSGHEEDPSLIEAEQPPKIQISTIHDIRRLPPRVSGVQHVDLVHLPLRNMDKGRNVALPIEQGMEFDC